MPLSVYYYDLSPSCRAVNLAVHALNIDATFKTVDLFQKEHLTPEFLKINHQHCLPTIVDEDLRYGRLILWDSHAINQYLVARYGKTDNPLYPTHLKKRAIVDQRLHYSNDIFFIMRNMTRKILLQKKQTIDEEDAKNMTECYSVVERYLTNSKWIAGDNMTIADFSYIAMFISLPEYVPFKSNCPNIVRWTLQCARLMKNYSQANERGSNALIEKIKGELKPAASTTEATM